MQDRLSSEVREEIQAAAASSGCELVHVELRGGQLQVILDRPEGVTISDCEQVAKKLSAVLDVLDFGSSAYTLEVSSPGLDRKLYGPRDYKRFSGHLARFTWSDPERGKRTDSRGFWTFHVRTHHIKPPHQGYLLYFNHLQSELQHFFSARRTALSGV